MSRELATCSTASWTSNSRGQSPCLVGSALAGACVGGDFTLTSLEPDYVYLGPSTTAATPCRCSSVYYSMLSACATCQGNNFIRWGRYSTNCTTVYMSVFPRDIPESISVPGWAYLDVEAQDTFNITLAQAFAGPESTPPAQAPTSSPTSRGTQTNTGRTSATGLGDPAATSGGSGGGTGEKKSSNTGAIAGGVVGGIVGLALIAGLIFFLLRRNKQKKRAPSAMYGPQGGFTEKPPAAQYTGDYAAVPVMPSPNLYDPNNPATFPTGDGSASYSSTPAPGQNATYAPPTPGYGQNFGAPQPNGNYIPPHMTGQSGNSGYTQPNSNYSHANTSLTQPSAPRYTGAPEL